MGVILEFSCTFSEHFALRTHLEATLGHKALVIRSSRVLEKGLQLAVTQCRSATLLKRTVSV